MVTPSPQGSPEFLTLLPQLRSINWIMGLSRVDASDVRLQFSW